MSKVAYEEEFELTKEHIKLIEHFNVDWCDDEFGAPAIDPKRPYGNSDVVRDMLEILEIKPVMHKEDEPIWHDAEEDRMVDLHKELETALQIVLSCKTFKPGLFGKKNKYGSDWERIK